jgi:hypothetical protein
MPKPLPLPSTDYLRECFDLCAETGRLIWRVRPVSHFGSGSFRDAQSTANNWNSIWAGQDALRTNDRGYRWGNLNSQRLYAHRVIWKLTHDSEPEIIDHVNGNSSDNRPSNLRSVSHTDNCRNQRLSARNRSGIVGVRWLERERRWLATKPGRGTGRFLGHFTSKALAIAARRKAEREAGYHRLHGSQKEKAE